MGKITTADHKCKEKLSHKIINNWQSGTGFENKKRNNKRQNNKFGYDTLYSNNHYHIISGKDDLNNSQFAVVPNETG